MTDFPVHGFVEPGFEPVRDVFHDNFHHDIEVGAGFCAVHEGRVVVDLWGGFQDRAGTRPWREDTLVNVYSTTKGLASIAFATLVDDGLIDYEAPVARYWPELRAARDGLTVAQLLSHQSGVCGLREPLAVETLYDWPEMIRRIEREAPHWEPGTAAGYHAILWGYLPDELARRVSGRTLGRILAERVAGPLGADVFLGLPDREHARVADLIGPNHARRQPDVLALMGIRLPPLYACALQNPSIQPWRHACSADWRRAEIAAANAHANARGIASIYAAVARDATHGSPGRTGSILSSAAVAALTVEEVGEAEDLVLGRPMRRGRGVTLNTLGQFGPEVSNFGHAGAGGSVGFADPARTLGVGYVMNQMEPGLDPDTRCHRLVTALYTCL